VQRLWQHQELIRCLQGQKQQNPPSKLVLQQLLVVGYGTELWYCQPAGPLAQRRVPPATGTGAQLLGWFKRVVVVWSRIGWVGGVQLASGTSLPVFRYDVAAAMSSS
jgi:hypothetical protein